MIAPEALEAAMLPHARMPERFESFCDHVRKLRERAGVRPATDIELIKAFDLIWNTFG